MSKLGAQCQMNIGALLDFCRITKCKAAMGINVRERSFYEELARLGVKGIYRHHPNESWGNPEQDAHNFVSRYLIPETAGFLDLLTYVLGYNEYAYADPHMSDGDRDRADRFASSLIEEVHDHLGIHAIVLNINTGHFREDILCFWRTLAALDECGQCKLGWHEYGWPEMDRQYRDGLVAGNDGMWGCLRWKMASRAIKDAGFKNVRFAITECGLDAGVGGLDNLGWRKARDDHGAALWNYIRSLAWYTDALERDDDVDLALLFGVGLNPDWDGKGFNVPMEIAHWIANYKIYPEVRNV